MQAMRLFAGFEMVVQVLWDAGVLEGDYGGWV